MKNIFSFKNFITEKLGISDSVLKQAKEIFDLINSDKSKFVFEYKYKLNDAPLKGPTDKLADEIIQDKSKAIKIFKIKIKIEPKSKQSAWAGYFSSNDLSINLTDRTNFNILTHELKHADRFFRMGSKTEEENLTKLKNISNTKQSKNISFKKFVDLEMFFYFLQKEEFESFFHQEYIIFKEFIEDKNPTTKEDVMKLWKEYNNTNRIPSRKTSPGYFTPYLFYSGKLKPGKYILEKSSLTNIGVHITIPENQRPFKFENWFDKKTIDSTIWEYLKQKKKINDSTPTGLDFLINKVINFLGQETPPPNKYLDIIQKYKNSLENQIEQRMETYSRKFARIPTTIIMETN